MPDETKYYLCKSDQHNKYYRYEREGLKLTLSWGRVGGSSQQQTLTFDSGYELEKFLAAKLKDKLRPRKEGTYVEMKEQELKQEEEVAKALGHQYKISRFEFVDLQLKKKAFGPQVDAGTLKILQQYDSTKWVYAEVMNSWSKDVIHLVLNKEEAWQLGAISEEKAKQVISFDKRFSSPDTKFVTGVRMVLKRIAAAVIAALKKFGDLGVRNLSDDGPSTAAAGMDWDSLAAETGASKQVLSKFGNLGVRILDI